jgi:DNA-binding response OmpR family regulator
MGSASRYCSHPLATIVCRSGLAPAALADVLRHRGVLTRFVTPAMVADDPAQAITDVAVVSLGTSGNLQRQMLRVLHARTNRSLPVVVLCRANCPDQVAAALLAGADDATGSDAGEIEIADRIARQVRHLASARPFADARPAQVRADDVARTVSYGEYRARLSPTQYRLLKALLLRQGRVVPRWRLAHFLWGRDPDGSEAAISAHVHLLRKLLQRTWPGTLRLVAEAPGGVRLIAS